MRDQARVYTRIVERPMTFDDMLASLYKDPGDDTRACFAALNEAGRKSMFSPGQIVMAPGLDGMPEETVAGLRRQRALAKPAFDGQIRATDTAPYNGSFDLLSLINDNDLALKGVGSTLDGVGAHLMERTKAVEASLGKLRTVYADALSRGVKLSSRQFSEMKSPVYGEIRTQLKGFGKTAIARHAEAVNVKDMLGLKHKQMAKAFKAGNEAKALSGIADAQTKAKALTEKVGKLGVVGKILNVSEITAGTVQGYKDKGYKGAIHGGGRETAGMVGSMVGGRMGTAAGVWAATALTLTVASGGTALIAGCLIIGAATAIGALAGDFAGTATFDQLTDDGAVIDQVLP